jgi:hypothetical protein
MYRVALSAGAVVLLGACSLGTGSLSSGFAESDYTTSSLRSSPSQSVALGGEPATERWAPSTKPAPGVQLAKLDDKAPSGTFEHAPVGALSDRDYSHTALDPELTAAAKSHSRDLAKWDRISHFGSDGSNPWDRVKRTGFHARLAAENVGTGQIDFQEVLRGWEESPGHNKNLLLADATHMGIALVQDPKTEFKSFWTLVIASPM